MPLLADPEALKFGTVLISGVGTLSSAEAPYGKFF